MNSANDTWQTFDKELPSPAMDIVVKQFNCELEYHTSLDSNEELMFTYTGQITNKHTDFELDNASPLAVWKYDNK